MPVMRVIGDDGIAVDYTPSGGDLTNDSVTNAFLSNMPADTVKANITGSVADPADVTKANFITWLALTLANISGDGALAAKSTVAAADIDARAVTAAKLFAASASSRVLGRITAGSGDWEELTGANIRTILGTLDADTVGGASLSTLNTSIGTKNKKGVAADLGTGSGANPTHVHNFGTLDVIAQLFTNSDGKEVSALYTRTDVNTVTWNLDITPTTGQYRSLVIPIA